MMATGISFVKVCLGLVHEVNHAAVSTGAFLEFPDAR